MAETAARSATSDSVARPLGFGVGIGLLLSILGRTLIAFDVGTVAVLLIAVGLSLGIWATDWWQNVGWTLLGAGVVVVAVLPLLMNL